VAGTRHKWPVHLTRSTYHAISGHVDRDLQGALVAKLLEAFFPTRVCGVVRVHPQEREWYFIAEQPAPAPHLAHPGGCAALRIAFTVPLLRAFSGWIRSPSFLVNLQVALVAKLLEALFPAGVWQLMRVVHLGWSTYHARKREFKLPWREAGPPNHHDDTVDSDQYSLYRLPWSRSCWRLCLPPGYVGLYA